MSNFPFASRSLGVAPLQWSRSIELSAPSDARGSASLADMAEEIGQMFSERRLSEKSTLEERGISAYENPALQRIAEIEALLETLGSDKNGSFSEQAQQLMAMLRIGATLGNLTANNRSPAELFLLLSLALAQGASLGDQDPATPMAQDAVDSLWLAHGSAIRADINIAPELKGGEDKGAADRAAYRGVVLDGADLADTIRQLTRAYGDDIDAAAQRLCRAIGADMRAMRPSLPQPLLELHLKNVGMAAKLRPILAMCSDLVRRLELKRRTSALGFDHPAGTGTSASVDTAAALLGDLAEWLTRWVSAVDVRLLAYQHGLNVDAGASATDSEDAVTSRVLAFLNGVNQIFRQMPVTLFESDEQRTQLRDALSGVLDKLVLGADFHSEPGPGNGEPSFTP